MNGCLSSADMTHGLPCIPRRRVVNQSNLLLVLRVGILETSLLQMVQEALLPARVTVRIVEELGDEKVHILLLDLLATTLASRWLILLYAHWRLLLMVLLLLR